MQRIENSARHLLNVIEDILTFSRAEAQRDEVHAETIEVGVLVAESIGMIEAVARHKNLEITAHVPAGLHPIQSDARKLRQIMLNLLSNAVKFTEQGSVAVVVAQDERCIRFAVRDTGPGIAADNLGRIYEPFWQAEQGATRRAGGTGLGLTVTRQLVELLGGRILVESVPGAGTTFTVELPG